jgi:hypothetical protein
MDVNNLTFLPIKLPITQLFNNDKTWVFEITEYNI